MTEGTFELPFHVFYFETDYMLFFNKKITYSALNFRIRMYIFYGKKLIFSYVT